MTLLAQRQAVRAAGFAGGRLLIDKHRTYWTLTLWDNEKSMKAFRGSGAHGRVMPKLVEWCDEAAYAHWITEVRRMKRQQTCDPRRHAAGIEKSTFV